MVLAERSRALRMLADHLTRTSLSEGSRRGAWTALTSYKFSSPACWSRDDGPRISFIVVVQGRHLLRIGERTLSQDTSHSVVAGAYARVACDVKEASFRRPYLAMVLEIDPGLVRRTWNELTIVDDQRASSAPTEPTLTPFTSVPPSARAFDWRALEVVLRADRNIASEADRQILAPLYQHEVVYWLLNSDLGQELRALTAIEHAEDPIADVIEHLRDHLTDSWHVADMADRAYMSPSVFTRRFREVTGRPPHQYLMEMRLDRARDLIVEGDLTVAQVSSQVGYRSVSQFTTAYRARFGTTPGRSSQASRAGGY